MKNSEKISEYGYEKIQNDFKNGKGFVPVAKSLACGLPFATYRRNDGTVGLQFLECLVDFLSVDSENLLDLSGTHGFSVLAHCFQNIVFYRHLISPMQPYDMRGI